MSADDPVLLEPVLRGPEGHLAHMVAALVEHGDRHAAALAHQRYLARAARAASRQPRRSPAALRPRTRRGPSTRLAGSGTSWASSDTSCAAAGRPAKSVTVEMRCSRSPRRSKLPVTNCRSVAQEGRDVLERAHLVVAPGEHLEQGLRAGAVRRPPAPRADARRARSASPSRRCARRDRRRRGARRGGADARGCLGTPPREPAGSAAPRTTGSGCCGLRSPRRRVTQLGGDDQPVDHLADLVPRGIGQRRSLSSSQRSSRAATTGTWSAARCWARNTR